MLFDVQEDQFFNFLGFALFFGVELTAGDDLLDAADFKFEVVKAIWIEGVGFLDETLIEFMVCLKKLETFDIFHGSHISCVVSNKSTVVLVSTLLNHFSRF